MISAEMGEERNTFIAFVEDALSALAKEDYTSFLSSFDSSRMTEQDLIQALRYMNETRPVLKIDDPTQVKKECSDVFFISFKDGSGYHMDYDLTTNGERNDLTIQVEFFREKNGYTVILDDLHTL